MTALSLVETAPCVVRRPAASGAKVTTAAAAPAPANLGEEEHVRPGTLFGPESDPYEVGEELGSGTAGKVFACRRLCAVGSEDEQDLAVKVINLRSLRLTADPKTSVARLDREVDILSQLRHERIVNLRAFHRTENWYFLVMERVRGGELFNQIVKKTCLNELEARHIFRQLLEGVGYMHTKRVIHRDLKPENILIVSSRPALGTAGGASSSSSSGGTLHEVKIADFGLSKIISDDVSQAKTRVGTPQYWAPEVLNAPQNGGTYDEAVDFWGLGALLFVMLCGRYPFDGKKIPLEEQIRTAAFNMETKRWQHISESAKSLVRGLLQVDIARRLRLEGCTCHPWLADPGPSAGLRPPGAGRSADAISEGDHCRPAAAATPPCGKSVSSPETTEVGVGTISPLPSSPSCASIGSDRSGTDEGRRTASRRQCPCLSHRLVYAALAAIVLLQFFFILFQHSPQYETVEDFSGSGFSKHFRLPGIIAPPKHLPVVAPSEVKSSIQPLPTGDPSAQSTQTTKNALTRPQIQTIPFLQLGTGRSGEEAEESEACRGQEKIFRLGELLKLQMSIVTSLETARLAVRKADPVFAGAIGQTSLQAQELFQNASEVVRRYGEVAAHVSRRVLPDLKVAIEERIPELAIDYLADVKEWVAEMKRDGQSLRLRYSNLKAAVMQLVQLADQRKLETDEKLAEAVEVLSGVPRGAAASQQVQRFDRAIADFSGQVAERNPAVGSGLDSEVGMCSRPTSQTAQIQDWRQLFEHLGKQLEPTSGDKEHAGSEVQDALIAVGAVEATEDWKQTLVDVLFLSPGVSPQSLPSLQPLNMTWGEVPTASLDAGVSDAGANASTSAAANGMAKRTLSAAIRYLPALVGSLRLLRRVDGILQGCFVFWENMDSTVQQLAQMKETTERLLGYTTSNERIREGFELRLEEYSQFWSDLGKLCTQYSLDHQAASSEMQKFILETSSVADLIDTAGSAGRLASRRAQHSNASEVALQRRES